MAKKSHKKLLFILLTIIIGMLGFCFALVPIYNSLCKEFGINGKPNNKTIPYAKNETKVVQDRTILVEFVTTNNNNIAWDFYPKIKKLRVHPGEMVKLAFYAKNKTDHKMTVQAIPSITPGMAAKFLKKTECFCFRKQVLNGHEGMDLPVLFHIDPKLPVNIKTLTLSYTLFDVT